jgi:uncharacterized membrane protein
MAKESTNSRLEVFCDGVFAIAITLLVLDIKIPRINSISSSTEFWHYIIDEWPAWFAFALSFVIILVAWVNHHDFFKLISNTRTTFTYANGLLLFSVASLPYTTGVMSEFMMTEYAQQGITVYCFGVLFHCFAWFVFLWTAMHPQPIMKDEATTALVNSTIVKYNRYAFFFYFLLCILSFWLPYVSLILMTLSWVIWIVTALKLKSGNDQV